MMGYTHTAVGSAGALAVASCMGLTTPETYLLAAMAGAVGGITPDFDVVDKQDDPKITDGSRSRIAALGTVAVALVLDTLLNCGILPLVIQRRYLAVGGLALFVALAMVGRKRGHRSFSHSLLYGLMMSACVWLIYPIIAPYFLIGFVLHLVLDILNYPYQKRGVMLLYPKDTGSRFALGWCTSSRKANKAFYFVGMIAYIAMTFWWLYINHNNARSIAIPLVISVYLVVSLHLVRVKSENELRQRDQMRGKR